MRSLHRQSHSYAERGQRHHWRGAHSDENHLPKNRRDLEKLPLKRRDENPIKDAEIEEEIIFHLPLERAECQGKWNEESAKFGERAMRKTRAVATLPEIKNATAEFRTKCFWSAMRLRIAFAGLVQKLR